MESDPYTNRELDEKFKNLDTLIREKHDDAMVLVNKVLVQATKTNGNVASLKMWRAYMAGAVVMLTIVVLRLLTWALLNVVTNSAKVSVLQSQIKTLTK